MIPDDKSRLRKIERELYTTDIVPPAKRGILHERKTEAPDDWRAPDSSRFGTMKKEAYSRSGGSVFKKIFLGSLVFLVLALVFFGISLLTGGNSISANNVDVAITTKSFVDGGETFPVDVSVINRNKVSLELATLTLQYPDSSSSSVNGMSSIHRDIGSLDVGGTHQETFNMQLYGEENSQKQITAHIEFRVPGSNVVYSKDQTYSVTVRTSPVRLTLTAPQNAVPNQEIPLAFNIIGNGTTTLTNTALVVQYPNGFTFTRADQQPSFGNNVWFLGDVPPGANRTITVYGTLAGGVNDTKTVQASIGAQNANNEEKLDVVYNSLAQVIPLTNAFLSAQITTDGGDQNQGSTIPISPSDQVSVTIPWQSTLTSQITNAEIHVRLSGSAFDPGAVQPGTGYFNTSKNELVWTSQQDQNLASINPGQMGAESFSFKPASGASGAASVIVAIDIQGVVTGGTQLSVQNIDKKTFVLSSDLNLLAGTIHYSGPISNSGPMPAVPNRETTYTLKWQVINSRNALSNVQISTTLPTYVVWKNVMVPDTEVSNVQYNSVTRVVTWNVGDVPAGSVNSGSARTLFMKIGITPSSSQNGTVPDLTGAITVMGHDTVTNTDLSITKRAMNTTLLNDTSSVGSDGVIGG
jgi:hypothetical protein